MVFAGMMTFVEYQQGDLLNTPVRKGNQIEEDLRCHDKYVALSKSLPPSPPICVIDLARQRAHTKRCMLLEVVPLLFYKWDLERPNV